MRRPTRLSVSRTITSFAFFQSLHYAFVYVENKGNPRKKVQANKTKVVRELSVFLTQVQDRVICVNGDSITVSCSSAAVK